MGAAAVDSRRAVVTMGAAVVDALDRVFLAYASMGAAVVPAQEHVYVYVCEHVRSGADGCSGSG